MTPSHNGSVQSGFSLPNLSSRSVLADDVYHVLRDHLISGRIPPGTHLNLDRLARELHVSNTPVRQALGRLEASGLVTKQPHRGFSASPLLDIRAVTDLYQFRLQIEPVAAGLAAANRTDALIDNLQAICARAEKLQQESTDEAIELLGRSDGDFHICVASAAGNAYVTEVLEQTLVRMRQFTMYRHFGAGAHAWNEHQVVAEAVIAGDSRAAEAAMRTHLTEGLARAKQVSPSAESVEDPTLSAANRA